MKKGEESRHRLIRCASELFWKNGYFATGVSEILKFAELPKGSFYFYFKSKDELAVEVIAYYQMVLTEKFQVIAKENDWESFVKRIFQEVLEGTEGEVFLGCPLAVIGMETAVNKPEIAVSYASALEEIRRIFKEVLLNSGLSEVQGETLSHRLLFAYQGGVLLGRIHTNTSYLKKTEDALLAIYREYRSYENV